MDRIVSEQKTKAEEEKNEEQKRGKEDDKQYNTLLLNIRKPCKKKISNIVHFS